MFARILALLLAGCMTLNAALVFATEAGGAPELLASSSGSVTIHREGDENPVKEIAKSVYWGAVAGAVLGGALMLADSGPSAAPLRWGIVLGSFAGLGAGIYFVAHRPVPASMLELRDGRLVPAGGALTAIEPVTGGARVRLVAVRF